MARREIEWVTFCYPARVSSASSPQQALTRGSARLFKDDVDGIAHVVIEDASLPSPANIPWSNVASVGWVPKAATK